MTVPPFTTPLLLRMNEEEDIHKEVTVNRINHISNNYGDVKAPTVDGNDDNEEQHDTSVEAFGQFEIHQGDEAPVSP